MDASQAESATGWLELAVSAPLEATEAVAEVLRHHAPGGVAIEEPFRSLDGDHAFALDPSRPAWMRAYVPLQPPVRLPSLRRRLRFELAELPWPTSLRTRRLSPTTLEEWAESWKAHFGVEKIGRRLVVRPSWIDYVQSIDEIVLRLDPGMAFGTGQHPTTRLCLRALEDYVRRGSRVLDVGTGSGILAIAAALLGARSVAAIDSDPLAVDVARTNVQANGVDRRVRLAEGGLGQSWPFVEPPAAFDCVAANISTGFVVENSAALMACLSPPPEAGPPAAATGSGGHLIVSGAPEERRIEAEAALTAAGARVIDRRADGGWCAIVATSARR